MAFILDVKPMFTPLATMLPTALTMFTPDALIQRIPPGSMNLCCAVDRRAVNRDVLCRPPNR